MIKFLDLQKVTALHGEEINEAVSRVVNGGWYLQGEENRRFEADYSAYIGTKYTVGCGNGLDALNSFVVQAIFTFLPFPSQRPAAYHAAG